MAVLKYMVIIAIGALASILANRGIAVFNDGFRAIVPQYYDGQLSRKELAAMSFAVSFGLVIGYGLPTSVGASVILIHCLLLATDIIGTACPDSPAGCILAGLLGGLYGLLLLLGLEFLVKLFGYLPYNFLDALGSVSAYVTVAFAVFPAVAVAQQHGFSKGALTAGISLLVWLLMKKYGTFTLVQDRTVTLNADGFAMLAGVALMIAFAAAVKGEGNANAQLTEVFSSRLARIRKNWILLAVMGGLLALGASMRIVAGDPGSMSAAIGGDYATAGLIALARAIGFVPLILTTSIVTGVYAPGGCTFVFAAGLFLHEIPGLALIAGAGVMVAELLLMNVFAGGMDRFPGVREMGEHIRTAMTKVIEITLTVGAVAAAEKMAADVAAVNSTGTAALTGAGALFVIGCVLLNRRSGKPMVEMAIGPAACILFGILLNLLLLTGLISPAA